MYLAWTWDRTGGGLVGAVRPGGDGAFLDDPAAEDQGAGRGEVESQQPQQHRPGDGERGGIVVSENLAGGLPAGQRPGAECELALSDPRSHHYRQNALDVAVCNGGWWAASSGRK